MTDVTTEVKNKVKPSFARYLTLFFCMVGMIAIGIYFFFWVGQLDPQGQANADCDKKDLLAISNNAGMEVSAFQTTCHHNENDSAVYVHLLKKGSLQSPQSLIFRYAAHPNTPVPIIEWKGDALSITVGDIFHISKMVSLHDGIKISYTIGKEDDSLVKGNEMRWAQQEVAIFLFLILILLLISSYKIIKSIKRDNKD